VAAFKLHLKNIRILNNIYISKRFFACIRRVSEH